MAHTLDLPVRLSLSGPVRPNAEVEVRLLLGHVMETGFRHDSSGVQVAKDILQFVKVHVGDVLVFEAELGTGMAANPMFFFSLTLPPQAGDMVVSWADHQGRTGQLSRPLVYR
ncbi:thiosulfate oxidation carrier complex protein SoxZ [Limnohabitans sp.]|jgi:sulfur-oxidizing protein SoxZ|uniref:thiosulfate oxidation carrier complex protein SoxZ n=1 Tax=Limnohabitans sp. TaxID=1907725 RepID=UPI0038B6C5AA